MWQRNAATGSDDTAWHGDVFKALWMIKAFHNNMTMSTFSNPQPQSLVYYSSKERSSERGLTLNEIANLTYDDTVSRRAEYNIGDEDQILKECIAAIKQRVRK